MLKSKVLATAALCLALTSFGNASFAADGPTDMQIAHIAYTAGNIDIRYAHMALAKSTNPEIREFATLMLQDHVAVNNQALALLKKLGASPEDNPTSQQLSAGADQKIAELSGLSGADFDKAYATNELSYHQFVNKTIAGTFIPAADNAEFKKLLRSALKVFRVHEGHADEMVKSL
jgi:putative membrane protein